MGRQGRRRDALAVRVALACPYAWDAPGGVQVHVGQLAGELREREHDVLVLAPALGSTRDDGVAIVGRAIRVPYQGTVAPICPSPLSVRRIARALRSFRPDVVHAHEPLAPSTAMFATISSPAPVVATFHAHAERSLLLDVAAPLLRPVWRRLAVRVAVSEAAAGFVTGRLAIGDGVRIVPNGVDVDLFAKAEPHPGLPPGRRILWVGRLDRQKGFPVAVRAFAELAGELPDVWFVVVGEGRDRQAVANVPGEIRRRILMVGSVSHQALPAYHAAADVFVSAALGQESFGLVLVEAMAAGVPVVATAIPGYREVARDGVDALLVPPGDPRALAGAIRRVLAEPATAAGLAGAGRARAESFRWSAVVSRLEDAYGYAIASRGTALSP
jgi:phosphatidylinositol alpha-mannosyltransferase